MFKKALLPMIIVAALSGCYDKNTTTVDGTSSVSLTDSLGKITGSLPGEQQAQYVEDVNLLKQNFQLDQLQVDLNGKNAQEIMATAQQLREKLLGDEQQKIQDELKAVAEEAKQRDLASLRSDIETLKAKREAELTKLQFKIDSALFAHAKNEITEANDPIINLQVTNNTKLDVFGVAFDGVLSVPGQAEPLHTGLLELTLEQGLQPGESISTSIKPSLISEWRSITAPDTAALSLTVNDLRNVKGESLVGGLSFSKGDDEQLSQMAQQLLALDPTAQGEVDALLNPAKVETTSAPVVEPTAEVTPEVTPEAAQVTPEAAAEPVSAAPEAIQPEVVKAMHVPVAADSETKFPLEAEAAPEAAPEAAVEVAATAPTTATAEAEVVAPEATTSEDNAPDFSQIKASTETPVAPEQKTETPAATPAS